MINVKNYGATGDGVNDNTKAFERAVKAAAKKGTDVFVPRGVYVVSSDGVPIEENVTIRGEAI